jgi:NAD(P)-dependent dehydrogenase (short-subunit alcohol dehydrogenase family)
VKKAADEFLSKDWPLHCLLLNAGLCEPLSDVSADGYGYAMAVNHLAHYYLNKLLLDRLERTAKQLSPDDLFGGRSVRKY